VTVNTRSIDNEMIGSINLRRLARSIVKDHQVVVAAHHLIQAHLRNINVTKKKRKKMIMLNSM